MSEKEAWLALRDVVHGLEYRKDFTQQPSTQVFHNEVKNFLKSLNFLFPKIFTRSFLFYLKTVRSEKEWYKLGISNRPENVLDLIVLSLVCNALFTVEINVFVPFTPITDRLSNGKCTNTQRPVKLGALLTPQKPHFL